MSFVDRKIIRVELEYCSIKFSSTNVVNIEDQSDIGVILSSRPELDHSTLHIMGIVISPHTALTT